MQLPFPDSVVASAELLRRNPGVRLIDYWRRGCSSMLVTMHELAASSVIAKIRGMIVEEEGKE
jgi:hypothetical protein